MYLARLSIHKLELDNTIPPSAQTPYELEIKVGDSIKLEANGQIYELTVKNISERNLTLATQQLLREAAGQAVTTAEWEYTMLIEENIIVRTLRADSPTKWILTLLETKNPLPDDEKVTSPPSPKSKPLPIKMPKLNWQETQGIIAHLEDQLQTKIICYYTSPSTSISDSHADLFLDHLQKTNKTEKLTLVVISYGGEVTAALRIANILRDFCQSLTVIAPSRCASAATMISLAADKILFTSNGYLTAIDSSIVHGLSPRDVNGRPSRVSVDQVKRIIKFLSTEPYAKEGEQVEGPYHTLFKYLHPLVVAEVDRSSTLSELVAKKIMQLHPTTFGSEEKINEIAKILVENYPTHGFPILCTEAQKIGLPADKVSREVEDQLWNLVKFYDRASWETITNMSPDLYHTEFFPLSLESAGMRTTNQWSYNRRFNPITKTWMTENDNSRLIKLLPPTSPNQTFSITAIDILETKKAPTDQTTAPTPANSINPVKHDQQPD